MLFSLTNGTLDQALPDTTILEGESTMRKMCVWAVAMLILIAAVPATFAQEETTGEKKCRKKCSPEGVWYGGSVIDDQGVFFKWLMKVTPGPNGTYYMTGESGFSWGVPVATNMNGVLKKVSKNRYEFFILGLQDPVGNYPPFNPPVIIAVHGYSEMTGCNSFAAEYDFQGLYFWGQEPFVDEPQDDFGPGAETYNRLPTPSWPPDWFTP